VTNARFPADDLLDAAFTTQSAIVAVGALLGPLGTLVDSDPHLQYSGSGAPNKDGHPLVAGSLPLHPVRLLLRLVPVVVPILVVIGILPVLLVLQVEVVEDRAEDGGVDVVELLDRLPGRVA